MLSLVQFCYFILCKQHIESILVSGGILHCPRYYVFTLLDAFETLNKLVPINRTSPEVLTLVLDFWDRHGRNQRRNLTNSRVLRLGKIFTSRPSSWTDFDCKE